MTEAELKAMFLNQIQYISTGGEFSADIQRVPNGWNYIYTFNDHIAVQFVPEVLPIIQHVAPRE